MKKLLTISVISLALMSTNQVIAQHVIDFESFPGGYPTSYTVSGVTFTGVGGGTLWTGIGPNGTYGLLSDSSPMEELRADADTHLFTSVSVDIGDFDADSDRLFLEVYAADDTLLAYTDYVIASDFTGMVTLSLAAPEIAYAVFGAREAVNGSSVYSDNFTFNLLIAVEIDVKPGSYPSSINMKKKGVTPVAIHTTDDFDATTVDPESVVWTPCGVSPINWKIYDCDEIPNPLYGDPLYPDAPEMIGDGDLDLVLYFDTQELVAAGCINQCTTEATLMGMTEDGDSIVGIGDVRIVKQGKP